MAEGLLGPVGMALLPDGRLLIAEEGSGDRDTSAGITLVTEEGLSARLISGLPSSRDAGDLAGVPLVQVSPDGKTIYVGNFGQDHLWVLAVDEVGPGLPEQPFQPSDLGIAMPPLNNVRLVNPFDMTFDTQGMPVVSDASENGVATVNADGTARFFHRFDRIPNPVRATQPVEAVPTGIMRLDDQNEYLVALFGGCPYPASSGQIVAVDQERNQRAVVAGLNLPIDVAQGSDGTIWVLEFAQFEPGASCFDGSGYQPQSGRLSILHPEGQLETVLDGLDYPGAVLPADDGSLYLSEVFSGRVLHISFDEQAEDAVDGPTGFINVAAEMGLDFQHGAFQAGISMDPVAAMGGGVCWIDYDNDGWLDIYLVNSHALDEVTFWENDLPENGLYRNLYGQQFQPINHASQSDLALRGNGCVAADFNLDGWTDIYITAHGPNALLWNQGNGTFTEGGAMAGVDAPEWSSAATVGDLNGDGWPDLFVAGYIDLEETIPKPTGHFPQDFYGIPDRLYLSQGIDSATGQVTFQEVTKAVGLERAERGLGAILSDLDQDGDLDLYIANDGHPNRLYANQPMPDTPQGFRFVDLTDSADVGDSGSGMGVTGGDYDGDGAPDLFVTNWDSELNALYRNKQNDAGDDLTFQYSTYRIGLSGLGNGLTGWGTHMVDFDHDTDLDIVTVNGHVPITDFELDAELVRFYGNRTRQADGTEGRPGQFLDWTQQAGLSQVGPLMARGSAAADYDNDGDLDIAINNIGGVPALLENRLSQGNWLTVGTAKFAPGLQIILTLPDGRQLVREALCGSSYLASEDPRIHFGLGRIETILEMVVRWPDGRVENFDNIAVNQHLILE